MSALSGPVSTLHRLMPGVLLCLAVTAAAVAIQTIETAMFGRAWLEALVLAILLGAAVRTVWTPPAGVAVGVTLCSRTVLEVAIVLLGASVSAATVMAVGPLMLVGIVLLVAVAILLSYGIGRMMGLRRGMALLIACGNSICGNSAIAAVAPVIEADGEDVSSAIAFTAVLGVIVVLLLPLIGQGLGLSPVQFGVLSGLTVYAVPQVLAATAPAGAVAMQTGALVKLVRVLMLGPVCVVLALGMARRDGEFKRLNPARLVPWFIVGFVAMAALRSTGRLPEDWLPVIATVSTALTIIAMAGLGLETDLKAVARSAPRAAATVVLSLVCLFGLALLLIRVTG
jgi:uncharacterized integral membrane protein (TIGR00698 family)